MLEESDEPSMDVAQMAGRHIPAGIPSTLQRHLGYNSTGPGSRYADYTPHKHRGPAFDRWLLLTEAHHQISQVERYKVIEPFGGVYVPFPPRLSSTWLANVISGPTR